MATPQPVVKFTYEDYRTAPPDKRYELLDGDLTMVPAPNLRHQKVQFRLGRELGNFIVEHALGEFFYAPCDVVLSDTDVVQPDLLFVSREREHLLSGGENVRGAPDLVVEILSPATADRDRGYKRQLYGRHGVTEYWLVDPTAETVSIHRRRAGVLTVTRTFGRERRCARRYSPASNSTSTTSSHLEGVRPGPWREKNGAAPRAPDPRPTSTSERRGWDAPHCRGTAAWARPGASAGCSSSSVSGTAPCRGSATWAGAVSAGGVAGAASGTGSGRTR